jgi:uncharacterized membrane protein YphA (DoxX/SURF4 family)
MSNDSSPMSSLRAQTDKVKDVVESWSDPIKPYFPAIGRFLIVATFLEDAFRIVTQYKDQVTFLNLMRGIPSSLTHLFLAANVIGMIACSIMIIARKRSEYAVAGLTTSVVAQYIAYGYGFLFGLTFFLRNLSVLGGLMMVLVDSWVRQPSAMPGLPSVEEKDRKMYFQLAGRVLLIFLFVGFIFTGEWNRLRIVVAVLGFLACMMVVVGFKAKLSAVTLVAILSTFNILANNFWTARKDYWNVDSARYDFFQILSIIGGLVLLVNNGPGKYSIDEKRKTR